MLNFIIHILAVIPFIFPKKRSPLKKEIGLNSKFVLLYFIGVVIYSAILSYFNIFGVISISISIIILFGVSILFSVSIKFCTHIHSNQASKGSMDFVEFCKLYEISKREAEIILEICSGKSNKAIAEKLFITLQTVKDHNHRIFTKTGIKSRVQLSNLVRDKQLLK